MINDLSALLGPVLSVCESAAEAILEVYHDETGLDVDTKSDNSPVTKADIAANTIIEKRLKSIADIPILTEESSVTPFKTRSEWNEYWLVDPLDGTKEFIRRNDQFTVNIALIRRGEPVLGVVYVPVGAIAFTGVIDETNKPVKRFAQKYIDGVAQQIQAKAFSTDNPPRVVASRHHLSAETEAIIRALATRFGEPETQSVGSSLKFCLLADGRADIYPRLAPTSEWDTAAAHAVLRAAGGEVYTLNHQPLRYNTKDSVLNPHFYAVADPTCPWPEWLSSAS